MKIFLSHSSSDKPLMREIERYMEPGLKAWLDEKEIAWGQNLAGSIRDAIISSDFFIIFLDDEALESKWVMDELTWAQEKESRDGSTFVLPVLLPKVHQDRIPDSIRTRLFLTLPDSEESSVRHLTDTIIRKILQILLRLRDSNGLGAKAMGNLTETAASRVNKYIDCSEKVERIENRMTRKQLVRVLDSASRLIYVVVGAPQIYQHDQKILTGMNRGDIYRATHPFIANKKAHHMRSVQFRAYIQAQIEAAARDVLIQRLYIVSGDSKNLLSGLERDHLRKMRDEKKIDSRIAYLRDIPDNDLGEDFVIFDNNLLGVAVPKKGEMYGSEYRYSIDSDSQTIEDYRAYFDMLFENAIKLHKVFGTSGQLGADVWSPRVEKQHDILKPAFVHHTPVSINEREAQRLMIVLRTAGCAYDKDNAGCTMCDFKRHAVNPQQVNSRVLASQLEYAMNQAEFGPDAVSQIDLLTLGSFLHDKEVPDDFRRESFSSFSRIEGLQKVVIESRSPYIKEKKLIELRELLRVDQILEIGLGIESSNEFIRNEVMHKNLTDSHIRKVVETTARAGTEFLAYLLIGSMGLTESEMVKDAVDSASYVADLCGRAKTNFRIAFEPVFITHGTKLEEMYLQGDYKLINLWRVVDVIKRTTHLGTVFVGLSDEGLSSNRTPSGCPACTDKLKHAIEQFNGSQSLSEFDGLKCECQL